MEKARILERLIKENGYSVRSFALKCGIPESTLYTILKKGVGRASVDNIITICKNLGIKIEDLEEMAKDEEMEKAKILEALIKEHGYNLKSFATKCGIPYTTLYGIIKNGVGRASVDNIIIICEHLGITVEDLNNMAKGEKSTTLQPTYEDIQKLIARNGKNLSAEEKLELIKLLSDLK